MDAQVFHRALSARDPRFDGVFFVAVETTGVYCRPVCPARTPRLANCTFFRHAAEAERAGFRACFRCRPELAPGVATIDSVSRLVQAASARIDAGFLNERSLDELASELHVSARHLRRAFAAELGVSPIELAQTRRLALAKRLLHDTGLPLSQIAFASGFGSVRQFNSALRERFGEAPSKLRRLRVAKREPLADDALTLRLDYRPPLAWPELLAWLGGRAIAGVEHATADEYRRSVAIDGHAGVVTVRKHDTRGFLLAKVSPSLAPKLMEVVSRLRALFDLDARPDSVDAQLAVDPVLAASIAARPGLRVPGAFDPFETAVRTVLGQQITVRAATTLSGRLVARWGTPFETTLTGVERAFPAPELLAEAAPAQVAKLGMPEARARTLVALARAVADGTLDLSASADPELFIEDVQRIPGIGPWTAGYLAMRVLRWPDAFPAGDVALHKALGVTTARAAIARAEAFRPWRSYAVMHLWASLAAASKKQQGG